MARFVAFTVLLFCVAVQMTLIANRAEAAINCNSVTSGLAPCLTYIQGRTNSVPAGCCNGVRNVVSSARTTSDRRSACQCVKTAARSIGNINMGNTASLPGKCGVRLSFPISPNIDCNRIG